MENYEERSNQSSWEFWNSIEIQADESTYADLERVRRKIDFLQIQAPRRPLRYLLRIAAFIALPLLCSFFTYQYVMHRTQSETNWVECYAENGVRKQITLPDGTDVWLNSGSLLIYPQKFTWSKRQVYLDGEANFDVAENPHKPFIVQTHHLFVEALGTRFNVQSYLDMSKTIATLEEGKIKVETKTENPGSYILFPNKQIIYDHYTRQLTERVVDAERIALWKSGYLIFQTTSLNDVVHGLGKRFDMVVQFDTGKYENRTLTVRFSPEETLPDALNIIQEIVKDFNYKIKEKTLFIY